MEKARTLLLIDDDWIVLSVLNDILRPHYRTRLASSAAEGLALARRAPVPDLILLDLELPDRDGYAVCAELKDAPETEDIPVIFLSSHQDSDSITRGFALGAVDFVSKPAVAPVLLARVQTQLGLRDARRALALQNRSLEDLVAERTHSLLQRTAELQLNQDLMIVSLGCIAETRDNETGNHIQRTRAYVELLTRNLPESAYQNPDLSFSQRDIIWKSAPLHDIGKVGIPDSILLKPGRLTESEFEVMKGHARLGYTAICNAEAKVDTANSVLHTAAVIALHHHERWDGQGYPDGIGGDAIPLPARLMAVADVYDALTSRRVYKAASSHDDAIEAIRDARGRHFDPLVVDCFLEQAPLFESIAERYGEEADLPAPD